MDQSDGSDLIWKMADINQALMCTSAYSSHIGRKGYALTAPSPSWVNETDESMQTFMPTALHGVFS